MASAEEEGMKTGHRTSKSVWLVACWLLFLMGCSTESGNLQKTGTTDSGVAMPQVKVRDIMPMHFSSMAKPDTTITATVERWKLGLDDAIKRLDASTSVTTWPGNKAVAGSWKVSSGIEFKPSAPLADGDYLVRIKPDGDKLKVEREHTLFHVGSLPRVKQVRVTFGSKAAIQSKTYEAIFVWMSEPTDPSKWTLTVEAKQGGTFKALSAVNTSGSTFKLSAPIDVNSELRVTLGTEVGASSGVKLDGAYTGQAGSGAFSATFVPKDYLEPASQEMVYVPDIKL